MLVQKFLELFGVKIRQYFLARDERRHVCLIGELEHRPVGFAILADVDLGESVAALDEIMFASAE